MIKELKPLPCAHCAYYDIAVGATQIVMSIGQSQFEAYAKCQECGSTLNYFSDSLGVALYEVVLKWNRRASPWVRVEDGLPNVGELVLVRFYYPEQRNYEYKALRQYCESGWINPKNACCYDISSVTHWMPIPPLPVED